VLSRLTVLFPDGSEALDFLDPLAERTGAMIETSLGGKLWGRGLVGFGFMRMAFIYVEHVM
jgi:hypothetical protein